MAAIDQNIFKSGPMVFEKPFTPFGSLNRHSMPATLDLEAHPSIRIFKDWLVFAVLAAAAVLVITPSESIPCPIPLSHFAS
jgi:hypothetical protein